MTSALLLLMYNLIHMQAGCGMHIKSALAGVTEADRCSNWKQGSSAGCGGKK
eukprot:CAMPEP_0203717708 /NCGR_PEP_ID=MMETSP0092-20131115/2159_1 /ASSEMBLY_ACC=CAM_ASM_001090 /TAXON_ID=426623 /ORGANISM="Chaetoceros affinis, Strain CCMP159" /LENGTH=51 /DNA_ID=CAMNT_0050596651 /DNA_START=91 /DNA_END=246 /DNA_ORIENTATION=+